MSSISRRAMDMRAHRQEFLWDGRIPVGHITVIAGGPSKGKSTLGYRIAADVALPTIFVTTEEVDNTVWRPRLEASGVDTSIAFHHSEIKFGKGEEDRLGELVERYDAKLVIVDPLTNHLMCSINHDQAVRGVLTPYMDLMRDLDFSLLFQVHVLRDVAKNAHPLKAIPAGVVSSAKAVFLFGEHPAVEADPNLRVLACAEKFNFGKHPASLLFDIATKDVKVFDPKKRRWGTSEYAFLESRGEVAVSARALLVRMRPEDKERKQDRIAHHLITWLRDGAVPVYDLKQEADALDPPVSWRTVERVADEMGIIKEKDEDDARRLIWALPDHILATLEEAGDDEIEIEEVDIPDTIPPEWTEDADA
jgi:AAA domain